MCVCSMRVGLEVSRVPLLTETKRSEKMPTLPMGLHVMRLLDVMEEMPMTPGGSPVVRGEKLRGMERKSRRRSTSSIWTKECTVT